MVNELENDNKITKVLSGSDLDELIGFLIKKFNLNKGHLKDTPSFYKTIIDKLNKNIEIQDDSNLLDLLGKIGISEIQLSDPVFIIVEMPIQIEKLELRDLHSKWDNYWNPPVDDGLILQIPNGTTILLTHWNVIYYD